MSRFSFFTILLGTFLGMAVLYGPQPLLPLIARAFEVAETEAASLITWSLLAMSLGPLVVSFLLRLASPRRLIACCLLLLGITQYLFGYTDVLIGLNLLRFIQGMLISALLAATMTYIAATASDLRKVMALYVGSAIIGGLSGRLIAGFLSKHVSWTAFFLIMAGALVVAAACAFLLPREPERPAAARSIRDLFSVFKLPLVPVLYGIVFAGFFVMTALLNFIPFRLEALDPTLGEDIIALFYTGFLPGFLITLAAPRITDAMGHPVRVIVLGALLVMAGTCLAWIPSTMAIFCAIVSTTTGFFLLHAVTAPLLNTLAQGKNGSVNSLYVALYYLGGTAGSYLPGLVYEGTTWSLYILTLLAMIAGGLWLAGKAVTKISTYPSLTSNL